MTYPSEEETQTGDEAVVADVRGRRRDVVRAMRVLGTRRRRTILVVVER